MKYGCPHCREHFEDPPQTQMTWICPSCHRRVIEGAAGLTLTEPGEDGFRRVVAIQLRLLNAAHPGRRGLGMRGGHAADEGARVAL